MHLPAGTLLLFKDDAYYSNFLIPIEVCGFIVGKIASKYIVVLFICLFVFVQLEPNAGEVAVISILLNATTPFFFDQAPRTDPPPSTPPPYGTVRPPRPTPPPPKPSKFRSIKSLKLKIMCNYASKFRML